MTKTELISSVAQKADLTKKDAETAVNAILSSITDALVGGEKVSIVGFGTFEVRDRKEKQVINPQTKQMMTAFHVSPPDFLYGGEPFYEPPETACVRFWYMQHRQGHSAF